MKGCNVPIKKKTKPMLAFTDAINIYKNGQKRKNDIYNKVKSIITERGYGSTLTEDEARFELLSLGTEIGQYVENNPSLETVGRISNICISLQQLGYSYSLNELMQLLNLNANELQDVYDGIRKGTYGKVKSTSNINEKK